MDLQERIARRRSARQGRRIVVDRDQLSPVVHRPEPVGRGPVLEQLLDALEPIFDGSCRRRSRSSGRLDRHISGRDRDVRRVERPVRRLERAIESRRRQEVDEPSR